MLSGRSLALTEVSTLPAGVLSGGVRIAWTLMEQVVGNLDRDLLREEGPQGMSALIVANNDEYINRLGEGVL